MPILKREADIFPDSLFELDAPWTVAYVRSRQEKSFARYLRDHEIPFYLPQMEKTVRRGGRNFTSYLPLFTGYVFFRGEAGQAVRSHLTVSLLTPPDQPEFQQELQQIWHLQQTTGRLIPHAYLAPGDSVQITDGAFAGCRGVIVREKNDARLVVSVSFIRQSVAVEIDREFIRPEDSRETYAAAANW